MSNSKRTDDRQNPHICLISTEIFAWGKYGGYGRATRLLGSELTKRGLQVSAIIPRRTGQQEKENLDGIQVYGYNFFNFFQTLKIFKDCRANIYHSQEPSFGTYLAWLLHPQAKHMITFRDTRLFSDWLTEFRLPSLNRYQVLFNWIYEDNIFVRHAVRHADRRYIAANVLLDKATKKYHLKSPPEFLPTPVQISKVNEKSIEPTVCFVARWDRRKRPELMIALAKEFPQVHFIMAGNSRDKKYDQHLRQQLQELPNVELPGFIDQFNSDQLNKLLDRSWILINTAAREGLPNSFIEACAHQCAILSEVDPDSFSSNFGYCVKDGNFSAGLHYLLEDSHWKELGEKGYQHVKNTFEMKKVIEQHLAIYQELFSGRV
jgi:Glycosyltransferase